MGVLNKPDGQSWAQAALVFAKSPYFLITMAAHVVALIVMAACRVDLQWFWLLVYSWCTVPLSPYVVDAVCFFRGGLNDDQSGASSVGMLTCSTFVACESLDPGLGLSRPGLTATDTDTGTGSHTYCQLLMLPLLLLPLLPLLPGVFAKSIYNASTLGAKYGISGGLAYAAYYTAFPAAAICIYLMRTRHGYRSLPQAISERYGPTATLAFGLAVLYRLYQEVWSNSLVVGGFFGPTVGHSPEWWAAVVVSTAIPAFYSITGGMRSSLLTDIFQAAWKVCLLVVVLIIVGVHTAKLPGPPAFGTFNPAGTCQAPVAAASFAQCAALVGQPLAPGGLQLQEPGKAAFAYSPSTCSPYTSLNQTLCGLVGGAWSTPGCRPTTQPACSAAGGSWSPRPPLSLAGGMDLLVVAFLQGCLSYPFFDPVLTDRAFLAEPWAMLKAFLLGGVLAALFILLFSFIGIYGAMQAILEPQDVPLAIFAGVKAGIPASVAAFFGTATYSLLNIVFIISSCAVLDSTFASTAKLFGPEFVGVLQTGRPHPPSAAKPLHALVGRIMIVVVAVAGTVPLLQGPAALDATTISGTMIMGLGPPVWFLTFITGYRPLVFHLPFWAGVALGIVLQSLLGFNVVGVAVCWTLALLALAENWQGMGMELSAPFSLLGAANRRLLAMSTRLGLPSHWLVKAGTDSPATSTTDDQDLHCKAAALQLELSPSHDSDSGSEATLRAAGQGKPHTAQQAA
ncbi:hypothetical protein QJQ45_020099 [Haematococcus lacustris]|nr:hypothetical protein QJQ45_020099 [Haematococcus lacustris]